MIFFLIDLSAGLYPEIPEGSKLDFSALKEEVPHEVIYLFLFQQHSSAD